MKNTIIFTVFGGLAVLPSAALAAPIDWMPAGLPSFNKGPASSSSIASGGDALNNGAAGGSAFAGNGKTSVSPWANSNVNGNGANTQSTADAFTNPGVQGGSWSRGSAWAQGKTDGPTVNGIENLKGPDGLSLIQTTVNEESNLSFAVDPGNGGGAFTWSSSTGGQGGKPSSSGGGGHK